VETPVVTPRSTIAAADAARAIARGDTRALWRTTPDGGIEVAAPRRGRVELHVVHADGSAELVKASRPFIHEGVPTPVAFAIVLVGLLLQGRSWLFLMGALILAAAGMVLRFVNEQVELRLREWAPGSDSAWTTVPYYADIRPRTATQLIAAAKIADEQGGAASVRHVDDGKIEVMTRTDQNIEYRVVDEDGSVALVESEACVRMSLRNKAVIVVALASLGGSVAAGNFWNERWLLVVPLSLVALGYVLLYGMPSRPERARPDEWHQVRTAYDSGDAAE
jgi:hypothetical protein